MKRQHIIRLGLGAILLTFAHTIPAQQLAGGKVVIQNKTIKRQGNHVCVKMDLNMDKLYLKSNQELVFIPMIVKGSDTLKMPATEIMGRKRYIYYQRTHKTATPTPLIVSRRTNKKPQTICYTYSTPFMNWMNNSQLVIGQDVCGCNQAIVEEGVLCNIGNAVMGPQKLHYAYVQPKAETIKTRREKGTAKLNFNINKAFINTKLGNNHAEIDKMRKTIDLVKNDPDVTITSITLHGYASPDGKYALNEKLANDRTMALYRYLCSTYPVAEKQFQTSSTAEDWTGVRNYVENNDVPQKQVVLDIINSKMKPDEKEHAIATKAGEAHRYLIDKVYPQLRRTDYTIQYEVKAFNLEEARKVMKTRPQKLSLKEMYAVANSYPKGSKEFNNVFETAVVLFPHDELANLNAAYVAIDRHDTAKAEKHLKKAGNRPEADNARGALAVLKSDYQTAKKYFEKAANAGLDEAKTNLEELLKRL